MDDRSHVMANAMLDKLPMFASDLDIAHAIVGKGRAAEWKRDILPALERKGFPGKDPAHGGRPVPLVRRFYNSYFGITAGVAMAKPDGEDSVGTWLGKRVEKRIDDEERRRAAGEEVVERDPGTTNPRTLQAIADYRANKAAEYRAANGE